MEEQERNVLEEVVSPQESVSNKVDENTPETQEALPQDGELTDQEDPQEKNWRELRQTLKEFKNENKEIRRENQYLAQKLMEMDSGRKPVSTEEEEVDEDELVTYKSLKKYEQKLNQKLKAAEAETAVDRIKARFQDFEEVVTPENVRYLQENEPELVASLQNLKNDPYKQAIAAYKLLKKTDYYVNKEGEAMKKRAEENSKKPVSANAARKGTALADANRFANGLTTDLKSQLWKEMQEARKMA